MSKRPADDDDTGSQRNPFKVKLKRVTMIPGRSREFVVVDDEDDEQRDPLALEDMEDGEQPGCSHWEAGGSAPVLTAECDSTGGGDASPAAGHVTADCPIAEPDCEIAEPDCQIIEPDCQIVEPEECQIAEADGGAAQPTRGRSRERETGEHRMPRLNSADEHDLRNRVFRNYMSDDEFAELMLQHKFKVVAMKEDGACLFRAIAYQVYGDAELHNELRQECMDFMIKNRHIYGVYLTEDLDEYVARKRHPYEFGNHMEIQVLTNVIRRTITFHTYNPEPCFTFDPMEPPENREPVRLSYQRDCHFNAILKLPDDEQQQQQQTESMTVVPDIQELITAPETMYIDYPEIVYFDEPIEIDDSAEMYQVQVVDGTGGDGGQP